MTADSARSAPPAPRPTRESRVQRIGNGVVRFLLRSPLHGVLSRRLLVVTVTGRRTGRTYRVPVGYVEHDGALLIGAGGAWRRNLRPGEPVSVRLRGRDRLADAEVITNEERAADLYRPILRGNPVHGRFAGIGIEPDGGPNRADLRQALARGVAVVRLVPR
ncbi:MAG TPA: nitroreductase/quinone reductase family protein [Rugosimonospora sp.]|jgi:deazaflavin-dependent oxidoreductase (nitroreductase family)